MQEPSNEIRKRKVGEMAAEAITPAALGFGYAGSNLGDSTDVTKPALEPAKDRAQGALMPYLPQEVLADITDNDLEKLGRSGFISNYALRVVDKTDWIQALPDRPGLLASIFKACRTPLGMHTLLSFPIAHEGLHML
jgi:hypothetical protein